MSYFDDIFCKNIVKDCVSTIFEVGSMDLRDALGLYRYYQCPVYAFECNPDCISECSKTRSTFSTEENNAIHLIQKAVSEKNGTVVFHPFDIKKYNNMGSSSLLKVDFGKREPWDPDYMRENPQVDILVDSVRLDSFMVDSGIEKVDLICMDLQGYELYALMSMGDHIQNTKYIITETCIQSTYTGGSTFKDIHEYLTTKGFKYTCSNRFGTAFPDMTLKGYSEFDALFVNCKNT